MNERRLYAAFALVASAAIPAACSDAGSPPNSTPQAVQRAPVPKPALPVARADAPVLPSCLLITMDTTRADRLGAYGYANAQTPNLDRLAAGGVRFDRAYTPVPYTLPAHTSLFTGVYPPQHGVHLNSTTVLPPDVPILTEAFAGRGYRTGAFVSGAVLDSTYGLSRAFDVYDDELGPSATPTVIALSRIGERVAESALAWLESEPDRPFFCWAHFFDPHATYDPPSPYKERLADPYDGEIAYMDAQIGRLLSWLDARDLLQHTLVIALADHGEGLGEHGERTHGLLLYDSTLHVPLILSRPGNIAAGRVVSEPVSLLDVFPTVCELLGFESPRGVQGRSLTRALRGETLEPRALYAESEYCRFNFGWGALYSLSSGPWKYIESPRSELYERAQDPREVHDLVGSATDRARELAAELAQLRQSLSTHAPTLTAVDPELVAQLAGLGYAQGTSASDADPDAARVNPRDQLELLERFHTAIALGQRGRFAEMIEPLQQVVAAYPLGVAFRTELASAYFHAGRLDEAKLEAAAALKLDFEYHPAHVAMGNVLQKQEHYADAMVEFGKVLELRPDDLATHASAVNCLVKLGRIEAALVHARLLVERKPAKLDYWIGLAGLLRQAGRSDELKSVLEGALALDDGGLRVYAAWEFASNPVDSVRDGARAVQLCEQLLADGAPRDADVLDTLSAAYAEVGRFDDAITTAEQALEQARERGSDDLAQAIAGRLEKYRAGQPFRAK